ncbi:hypothetical protein C4901_06515 [Acidiferrobacter sp. SPIII_3]|nr:hypothetical protein C4901_06515 [Acidiferrobacter sp. SPIII_3]
MDQKTLWTTLRRSPTGAYIRIACYLWEQFSGRTLEDLPSIGGPTAPLFDPRRYVTAPGARAMRAGGCGSTQIRQSARKIRSICQISWGVQPFLQFTCWVNAGLSKKASPIKALLLRAYLNCRI